MPRGYGGMGGGCVAHSAQQAAAARAWHGVRCAMVYATAGGAKHAGALRVRAQRRRRAGGGGRALLALRYVLGGLRGWVVMGTGRKGG